MSTLIFQFSIRRSGTHVIGDWVQKQFKPPTKNLLNVKYPQLERTEDKAEGKHRPCNGLIISFESHPLETIEKIEERGCFHKMFGIYDNVRYLIGLRDPWNLFASRIRHGVRRLRHPADYLWTEYARAFIERPYDAEYVLYHEFLYDEYVRRDLSEAIGGTFDDSNINVVPKYGDGSSFDGQKYDGRGRTMDVFGRWTAYWEEESFRDLFTEEVRGLCREIFGTDDPGAFARMKKARREK